MDSWMSDVALRTPKKQKDPGVDREPIWIVALCCFSGFLKVFYSKVSADCHFFFAESLGVSAKQNVLGCFVAPAHYLEGSGFGFGYRRRVQIKAVKVKGSKKRHQVSGSNNAIPSSKVSNKVSSVFK